MRWTDLYQLFQDVRARPSMYVGDRSLAVLETMTAGYERALAVHDIQEFGTEFSWRFRHHLRHRFKWAMACGWAAAIIDNTASPNEAFALFFDLLDDFKCIRDAELQRGEVAPTVVRTASGGIENQDRAQCVHLDGFLKCMVADGAGGMSGGSAAAQMFIDSMSSRRITDDREAAAALRSIDHFLEIHSEFGETTGVLVCVAGSGLFGASVGDSGAWLITPTDVDVLTEKQSRKPLLGNGEASSTSFVRAHAMGRLLIATDGLLKYVPQERIVEIVRSHDEIARAADELLAAARLPSGHLQDDLTLVLVDLPVATAG